MTWIRDCILTPILTVLYYFHTFRLLLESVLQCLFLYCSVLCVNLLILFTIQSFFLFFLSFLFFFKLKFHSVCITFPSFLILLFHFFFFFLRLITYTLTTQTWFDPCRNSARLATKVSVLMLKLDTVNSASTPWT